MHVNKRIASQPSKLTLRTMPSYLGAYEAHSQIMRVPSMRKMLPKEKDTLNLQALMSAPVTCTLPLTDLLKVKPELWDEVALCLTGQESKGKLLGLKDLLKEHSLGDMLKQHTPVPINKVGEYSEGDRGNTTLPLEFEKIISTAILDSGAGISIATKEVWKKWGKPAVRTTRMNLQLADGSLENPIGLLENVTVTSCGIEYEHTFAIVDFGKMANYEVILGRPFMRQFKMIQDWGYNYLYLRQDHAITRVNLKNHNYRDVTGSPVEEFDSASSKATKRTLSEDRADLWMCGASRRSIQDLMDPNGVGMLWMKLTCQLHSLPKHLNQQSGLIV